ncbi:hypothetical protein AVEN_59651-1 [Araneus ventricosus]|uniref:Uncharacterized protein n=1 Tax=Araneus ventricosus TaxID=182803 RepID=A0A4Y2BMH4_ARAVE|nr:hypothetical protein AVEN_59651-1 [Araneus ventricosus]
MRRAPVACRQFQLRAPRVAGFLTNSTKKIRQVSRDGVYEICLPTAVVQSFEEGVSARVSSSSSSHDSKLQVMFTKQISCCRSYKHRNIVKRPQYIQEYLNAVDEGRGVEVWRGECQLRCRHLTAVQNYEVRPKIALVLLQNGTLI